MASEILQKMGELDKSLALLTRVLYVFERIWHTSFMPHKEVCLLSYAENQQARSFFHAMFK